MKKIPFVASFIALLLVLAVSAGSAHWRTLSVEEIVKRTKAAYAGTGSAEVQFEQMSRMGVSTGTLQFASGNRYRLDLGQQTIVSNGSVVWTWSPVRNQVVISKGTPGRGALTPKEILTSFPGDYTTTLLGETTVDGHPVYVVRCTAGAKKVGDVSEAALYIDKSTFRFHRIELVSPAMGPVAVRVLSARYDAEIPDTRFTFRPPMGARVVDLRR